VLLAGKQRFQGGFPFFNREPDVKLSVRRCKDYGASDFPELTGERSHCADPLTILRQEGPAIFFFVSGV